MVGLVEHFRMVLVVDVVVDGSVVAMLLVQRAIAACRCPTSVLSRSSEPIVTIQGKDELGSFRVILQLRDDCDSRRHHQCLKPPEPLVDVV